MERRGRAGQGKGAARQDGRYANTPATEAFIDRAKPTYLGGILE